MQHLFTLLQRSLTRSLPSVLPADPLETVAARKKKSWQRALLLLLPLLALAGVGRAQTADQYSVVASSGTFTPLVGSTAVTVINVDDAGSGPFTLGFNFVFEGVTYTSVGASSNGHLVLGAAASSNATNNLNTLTPRPILAPLWDDLSGASGGAASYLTTGTAPNRVFTFEWLNWKWNYQATTAVMSFQVKLYEGTNRIDYVYRQESTAYNAGFSGGASIGLAGATSGKFLSLQDVSSNPAVSNTVEQTALGAKPATGQVYSFAPVPQSVASSAVSQTGGPVTVGSTNQVVATLAINTVGSFPALGPLTQILANTNGTTNAADLASARVFYGGTSSSFSSAVPFGNLVTGPSGALTFNGSQVLATGTNYFFLVYNISGAATVGNAVDAEVTQLTVGGSNIVPVPTAPTQVFTVVGNTPLNNASTPSGFYTINSTLPTDYFNVTPGTNFQTFGDAFTALNAVGVSGPVTFSVIDGQTFNESNLTLNAIQGASALNPILFQRDFSTGSQPLILAAAGTNANTAATRDAIIRLVGTDFVTFDGLALRDPATNTTSTTQMEYGFALLRGGTGASTNGTNNNAIMNCSIVLQRANTTATANTAIGIALLANGPASFGTNLSAAGVTAAGRSSNNVFQGNVIENVNTGIYLIGLADPAPYSNYDQNNSVGGLNLPPLTGTVATPGNYIRNYGGTTGVTAYGIRVFFQNGVNLNNNRFDNAFLLGTAAGAGLAGEAGVLSVAPLFGVLYDAGASDATVTANGNNLLLNQGANASTVTGIGLTSNNNSVLTVQGNIFAYNALTGNTGNMFAISTTGNVSGTGVINISSNIFANSSNIASSGSLYFIYNFGNGSNNTTISNNQFKSVTKTVAGGTVYGVYSYYSFVTAPVSGTQTLNNNLVQTIGLVGVTGFYGYYVFSNSLIQTNAITNNQVDGVTVAGTTGSTAFYGYFLQTGGPNSQVTGNTAMNLSNNNNLYGMYNNGGYQTGLNFADNKIGNLTVSNTASALLYGIYLAGSSTPVGTHTYQRNRIYNLNNSVAGTSATVNGFYISAAPVTLNIFNNLIGVLNLPASTSTGTALAGLYLGAGTNVNVYHNTVLLNGATTTTTTALQTAAFIAFTGPNLDLRNNVFVNTTAVGSSATFRAIAFQRNGLHSATNYAPTSNGNLFYAGTPSTKNLLFYDGTNSVQTLTGGTTTSPFTGYRPLLSSLSIADRDLVSATETAAPTFATTTGTTTPGDGFLRITSATSAAKGGVASSLTTDYLSAARNATTPNIGAYEGVLTPADRVGPNISYVGLTNGPTGSTTRTVNNIFITDGTGVNNTVGTAPRLYYQRSTDPNTVIAANDNSANGWKYVEGTPTGSNYTFVIDYNKLISGGILAANTVIRYFVVAQDVVGTPNVSYFGGPAGPQPATALASVNVATGNLPATVTALNSFTVVGSIPTTGVTVGSGGTYNNLTGATGLFNALNTGVLTGNTVVQVISNTTEDGSVALNALTTSPAGSPFTLTIQGDATAAQYTLLAPTLTTPMIRLNGAQRVTFDGGSTANRRLLFRAGTNAALAFPTFSFINESSNNTLRFLVIEGTNTGTSSGTVFFGSGATGGAGNSGNLLVGNDIRQSSFAGNLIVPANGIYSAGLSAVVPNRANVVQNNDIHNFTNSGVFVASSSENWTIGATASNSAEGNRMYQDGAITVSSPYFGGVYVTGGNDHVVRYNQVFQAATGTITAPGTTHQMFFNSTATNNLDVSFNDIGGSGAFPITITNTGTFASNNGLNLSVGSLAASSIQGNTVRNFRMASTTNGNTLVGLTIGSGLVNVGNLTGNTIGDVLPALGLSQTTSTTAITAGVTGLNITGLAGGSVVNNNAVRNISNTGTGASNGLAITGAVFGGSTAYTASNNTINGVFNSSPAVGTGPVTTGMSISNSNLNFAARFNTISNVRYTGTAASSVANLVIGLNVTTGPVAGARISENTLFNISSDGSSSSNELVRGISNSSSATLANNRVSLTGGAAVSPFVQGIIDFSTGTPNFFYNTVYLSGSSPTSSYGFYRVGATGTATLRNNIFYNERGGGGAAYAAGVSNTTAFTAASSNNNLFVTTDLTKLADFAGTDRTLAQFKVSTGGDQRSYADTPAGTPSASAFVNPANNLKINPSFYATPTVIEGQGVAVSITTDFESDVRPGNSANPDLGADEFNGTLAPVQNYAASSVTQISASTFQGGLNQAVLRLNVQTTNALAPLSLTSLDLTLAGTTNFAADLVATNSVKVYYTGAASGFDVNTAQLYGTVNPATGTLTVTGSQELAAGNNFFFLTYDLTAGATIGNAIDGVINNFVVSGTTYLPNGGLAPAGDPAGNRVISGPMAGNYFVGTALGTEDFATVTDALTNLGGRGISAAVTLLLTNTATQYNTANGEIFPLILGPVAGASAGQRITIRPNGAPNAAIPVITGSVSAGAGSQVGGATLKLNGASFVTIDGSNIVGGTNRNLTIANTSSSSSGNAILWLANNGTTTSIGSNNNSVSNVILTGVSGISPQFGVFVGGSSVGTVTGNSVSANSNNTFDNIQVSKAFYGLTMQGVSTTVFDQNNVVRNSALGLPGLNNGFGVEGIRTFNQQNLVIDKNEVQNVASNAAGLIIGIRLTDARTAVVNRNFVHDVQYQGPVASSAYGIYASNGVAAAPSNHTITNNMVYGITAPSATGSSPTTLPGAVGIATSSGTGDKFYYNSVLLGGTLNNTAGNVSAAFANGDGGTFSATPTTNVDVRNNIFAITGTSGAAAKQYAHFTRATTYTGSTLAYNDLFVATTAPALGNVGYFNGADRALLTDWNTATTQDAPGTAAAPQSRSVDPLFVSATDLHLSNLSPLDNSGLLAAAITAVAPRDFDNELRPGSAGYTGPGTVPDIGADEMTVPLRDLSIAALVAPAASNCYSGSQPVTVTIANNSGTALTSTLVPVRVVITPPSGPVQTLNANFSGSIPANSSVSFTVGNYSAAVVGSYTVDARTLYANDANSANDALPTQTVAVAAPATLTLAVSPNQTSFCRNALITFTATSADAASTYAWTSTAGGGLNAITGATVTANPTQTGSVTYSVTATNGACSATQSVVITVLPLPAVTLSTTLPGQCLGGGAVQVNALNPAVVPTVRITDVMINRFGTGAGTIAAFATAQDMIEISNLGSSPASVGGLVVQSYSTTVLDRSVTLPTGTVIPVGGVLVVGFETGTDAPGNRYFYTGGTSDSYFSGSLVGFVVKSAGGAVVDAVALNSYVFPAVSGVSASDFTGNIPSSSGFAGIVRTGANDTNAAADFTVASATVLESIGTYNTAQNYTVLAPPSTFTYAYSALPATGTFSSTSAQSPTFTPTNPGTYTISLTTTDNTTTCQSTTTTSFTILPRPQATLSNGGPINYNTATTVSIALTGTGPWSFTYTTNGANPVSVTNTNLNPYSFSTGVLASNTSYQVTALNNATCAANAADLATAGFATTVTVIPPAIDFQPTALVSPVVSAINCYGGTETVTVRVKNNGTATVNLATDPVTVNVVVGGVVAVNLTATANTGSIISGGTLDVAMSATLNMLAPGGYTFAISTVSASDPNTGNNTLSAARTTRDVPNITLSAVPGTSCFGDAPVQINALNPALVPTLRITEVTLFSAGTGQTSPYPGFVTTADADFVEISNLGSSPTDASGLVFQDWSSAAATAANRSFTFPAGTVVPVGGVIVVSMGTGTDAPANRYFNTGGTAQYSSGGLAGFVLKNGAGAVIDAVGTNGFVFPAASNVTTGDFSGNAPALGGNAGTVRTAANDTNTGADFTTSATVTQTIGTYNTAQNYTLLAPPSTFTYAYSASPATGSFSSTSAQSPTFTPTNPGTYTISLLTTDNACANSFSTATTTLTVNPRPSVTLSNGGPINYNTATTVMATLVGTAPWSITYTANGGTPVTVSAATSPFTFSTGTLSTSTTYQVTALTDAVCAANAADLATPGFATTVIVNTPPVDFQPTVLVSPTAGPCQNATQTVVVRVKNNGSAVIDLSTDPVSVSVAITGATTATLTGASANTGTIPLGGTIDITLTPTLNLTAVGTYSFAITTSSPNDLNAGNNVLTVTRTVAQPSAIPVATATPPALCLGNTSVLNAIGTSPTGTTYAVYRSTYAPFAVPGTGVTAFNGTSSLAGGSYDQGFFSTPLPFDFQFFGQPNVAGSAVFLGTNGYVSFGQGYTSDNTGNIPATTGVNNFIAGDGRDMQIANGGTISTFTVGTAPNRVFVIDYANIAAYSAGNPTGSFQIALREGSNLIDIISVNLPSTTHTQGIENAAGTVGFSSFPATASTATAWALTAQQYTFAPTITTGPGQLVYNWTSASPGAGLPTVTTGQSITVTPTATSTYSVTAFDGTCTTAPATVTVTVNTTTTWLGDAATGLKTDWTNPLNWTNCVPSALVNAIVPAVTGTALYPILTTGTASALNLTIAGVGVVMINNAAATLDVKGDLTTVGAASLVATAGTVSFTSAAPQSIGAASFFNLTLTGTGANLKTLGGDITIANGLNLTGGMLALGSNKTTMTGTATITGFSATNFVVAGGTGTLCYATVGVGAGATRTTAFFPIGSTPTSYTPSTLVNTGTVDTFCGAVQDAVTNVPALTVGSVGYVRKQWDVSEAIIGGSSATLTFTWNAADEVAGFNRNLVDIVHYTGGAWRPNGFKTYTAAVGTNPYSLTRSGYTSFSPFAVQDGSKPLPVELTTFGAIRKGANALLDWATASEKDNAGFEVQVSTNAQAFRTLHFMEPASANSAAPRSYTYTDREAGKTGLRYYRLAQRDLDGTVNYSPVRTVLFDGVTESTLTAAPNPFGGELTLTVTTSKPLEGATLTLTDAAGRTVLTQRVDVPAGSSTLSLTNLDRLPAGVYLLHLPLDGKMQHLKVVKE